jgi:4'-phosphopantetheinyl transferase
VRTIAPRPWPPAEPPALEPGTPHVWSIDLDGPADLAVLSAEERDRAQRFATATLTRRWSRARSGLRRVLAAYAYAEPEALAIEPAACVHCGEPHGKPYLADPPLEGLRFNLTHSADLAVVAVAHDREVGVDVEARRGGRRMEGIAGRWFNPSEAETLATLEGAEQEALFYRLWARKEAYLKATAEGIAGSLAAFDALLLEPPGGAEGWEFADLDVGGGYAGALALAPAGFVPATAPADGGRRSP